MALAATLASTYAAIALGLMASGLVALRVCPMC
jgi:hypothetical protein